MTKSSPQDLAILGGPIAFPDPLHVGRPNIGNRKRLRKRLAAILDRSILTNNGPCVQEFEETLAGRLGVKYCVTTCNATLALQLAAHVLQLSGEVILPSFTFVATAHAMAWEGLTPVFCDVDPSLHTLDPSEVERLVTERTTAILGVHVWGQPCQIHTLTRIAAKHKLRLFFDAAHAVGCSYEGRMLGGFGDLEILSFHATKVLNAFEGGAVATNDIDLADELRLVRNFGFAGVDRVSRLGINGKMSEISAAMGLTSLESLDAFCARNRRNYELYRAHLQEVAGIELRQYDASEKHNYHYIVAKCTASEGGLTRDELLAVLQSENVLARRYFYPGCHEMEPYRSTCPEARFRLRNTRRLTDSILTLPNGMAIGEWEIRRICRIVQLAEENADQVRCALQRRNDGCTEGAARPAAVASPIKRAA